MNLELPQNYDDIIVMNKIKNFVAAHTPLLNSLPDHPKIASSTPVDSSVAVAGALPRQQLVPGFEVFLSLVVHVITKLRI